MRRKPNNEKFMIEQTNNFNENLYKQIAGLLQAARQAVVEIGRIIVKDEQQGKERAEYGKQVLKELSKRLTANFGKGFSVQNLENMRKFFLLYAPSEKSQSPIRISENNNAVLSWTHYLVLIRIFASRYQTVLPDKQAFIELLEQGEV